MSPRSKLRNSVLVVLLLVALVGCKKSDPPGLIGEYFGTEDFKQPVGSRIDPDINFEWARGEPPFNGCPTPKYSVRWTGEITVPDGGVSSIGDDADDGAKLLIDGVEMTDIKKPGSAMSKKSLSAGSHMIVIEYWNQHAEGLIKLKWIPRGGEKQLVPASALSHHAVAEKK